MAKGSKNPSHGPLKMRDIARIAQVSIATISRVLHNSPLVDETTAKRVRAIIKRHNYVPNSTGKSLKSGHSGIYGVIVPDIGNPFFADFVKHFEQEIVNRDQEMLLAATDHLPEQMQSSTRRMLMRGVEGIVILESEIETESYETMLHNQVPIVTLNRLIVEKGVSDIALQAVKGMTAGVRLLHRLGHRQIGYLTGIPGQVISSDREMGFRTAMERAGIPLRNERVVPANFTVAGGRAAMAELLQQRDRVTAVLCANDLSAIGAMAAVRAAGLVPGKDISIIGLDDLDICTILHPPLTTLRVSRERLVGLFFEALESMARAPQETGKQYMIELQLIERESTGPCPVAGGARSSRRKSARS
jgi:LacI family transcriptional regulator